MIASCLLPVESVSYAFRVPYLKLSFPFNINGGYNPPRITSQHMKHSKLIVYAPTKCSHPNMDAIFDTYMNPFHSKSHQITSTLSSTAHSHLRSMLRTLN